MPQSRFAIITFMDDNTPGLSPGHDLPSGPVHPWFPGHGGGPRPDQGLPGGGGHPWFPGHGGGGHPWFPGHLGGPRPDQGLPSPGYPSGQPLPPPVGPDNTLPSGPPGVPVQLPVFPPPSAGTKPIDPDTKFELKFSPIYGWVLVPVGGESAEPK